MSQRSCTVRALAAVLSLSAAALVPAETASAAAPSPPPPSSAISQYVEQIPTAGGSIAAGVGSTHTRLLPSKILARIRHVSPASKDTLVSIATSPAYGAPQQQGSNGPKKTSTGSESPKLKAPKVPRVGSTLSAVADSIDVGGTLRGLGLLAVLVGTAIGMIGASFLRSRRGEDFPGPGGDVRT